MKNNWRGSLQTWHQKCTSHMKQNETCGALAKANLLAPVSFYQNLNIRFATLLSGTGGPARNRHGSNSV